MEKVLDKVHRVFIFAHCDDEIFCLPFFTDKNSVSTIIFLTTSNERENQNLFKQTRYLEALKANKLLNRFNSVETIFFDEKIADGAIHKEFSAEMYTKLTGLILSASPNELITLCFEGGHQDHDTVELISSMISSKYGLNSLSCSSYRSSKYSSRAFSVMNPITPDRKIEFNRFLVLTLAIRLMLIYRSQARTWLGLAPLILFRYTFGTFKVNKKRSSLDLESFPNCFYQNRKRSIQNEVLMKLEQLKITLNTK